MAVVPTCTITVTVEALPGVELPAGLSGTLTVDGVALDISIPTTTTATFTTEANVLITLNGEVLLNLTLPCIEFSTTLNIADLLLVTITVTEN